MLCIFLKNQITIRIEKQSTFRHYTIGNMLTWLTLRLRWFYNFNNSVNTKPNIKYI